MALLRSATHKGLRSTTATGANARVGSVVLVVTGLVRRVGELLSGVDIVLREGVDVHACLLALQSARVFFLEQRVLGVYEHFAKNLHMLAPHVSRPCPSPPLPLPPFLASRFKRVDVPRTLMTLWAHRRRSRFR